MPRKPDGSDGGPADDPPANADPISPKSADIVPMTTSPLFDLWLERNMKALLAACEQDPDQALVDRIRRELASRDRKVTE